MRGPAIGGVLAIIMLGISLWLDLHMALETLGIVCAIAIVFASVMAIINTSHGSLP